MAKPDLIRELAELGVTDQASVIEGIDKLTGEETVPQLQAVLAKVKAAKAPEPVVPQTPAEGDQSKPPAETPPAAPPTQAPAEESATPPAPPSEVASAPSPAEVSDEDFGDSVDVLQNKNFIRYFSREVHGDDFLELAKQLVAKPDYAKRNYRLVPSSQIQVLEVRYREKEDAEKHLDDQKPDAPILDKRRRFENRESAIAFCVEKSVEAPASIVAVGAK